MLGPSLAVLAGLFASLASVCAKLAMAEEATLHFCMWISLTNLIPSCSVTESLKPFASRTPITAKDRLLKVVFFQIVLYARILFFILIFLCNALMWTLFVRSLQKCYSSIEATVTNASSNLIFTALFGKVLFGEILSLAWCCGAALIVVGLALVHADSRENDKEKIS